MMSKPLSYLLHGLLAGLTLVSALAPTLAHADRVKDLTHVAAMRSNQLIGYGLVVGLQGTGDGSDAHYNNDFFGGDLEGIIQKLDDIKDLGANAIYMTPVFKASSNHKYDTADFHEIDPAFGTNADFTRLTQEAAKRGIRVIPDASLNHVGADSRYFDRFGNYTHQDLGAFANNRIQTKSPYASW